jgi:predicted metal-dependent RNase
MVISTEFFYRHNILCFWQVCCYLEQKNYMQIAFHGAARNVTGSKHLITLDSGTQILLDCGMFQGMGGETDELNEYFGFDPQKVNYLILSHAHIDHSGLIPRLVSEGFTGDIFCTAATILPRSCLWILPGSRNRMPSTVINIG